MKRAVILLVCGLFTFAIVSCKKDKEKPAEEKAGEMGAPAADDMMAATADDMGNPPGDDMMAANPDDMGAPAGDMAAAPGGDATAEVDKILAKLIEQQKVHHALLKGIKTAADIKAKKDEHIKLSLELAQLEIDSAKKALTLPADQLKGYVAKISKMREDSIKMFEEMETMKKAMVKIKGAKKILAEIDKELAPKLKPLTEEASKLGKEIQAKAK